MRTRSRSVCSARSPSRRRPPSPTTCRSARRPSAMPTPPPSRPCSQPASRSAVTCGADRRTITTTHKPTTTTQPWCSRSTLRPTATPPTGSACSASAVATPSAITPAWARCSCISSATSSAAPSRATSAPHNVDEAESRRIDDLLRHLEIERRLSPHTLSNNRRALLDARHYLQEQHVAAWREVNAQHLRALVAARHRRGLDGRSLHRQLSALLSFYRYLLRFGLIGANPVIGIRPPKSPRRLHTALDVDQTSRLLDGGGGDDASPELTLRDRAILELLYSSGLRLAELVGLDIRDVDLDEHSVRVTGKGRKERVTPVGRQACDATRAGRHVRAHLASQDEQALSVSRRGNRISPRAVQQRVRHWGRKQGLDTPLHPHMLRHSCASHVLESSGALRTVQELLGHADIATTQLYTRLDFQHLAKVYDQAHPRARKKK